MHDSGSCLGVPVVEGRFKSPSVRLWQVDSTRKPTVLGRLCPSHFSLVKATIFLNKQRPRIETWPNTSRCFDQPFKVFMTGHRWFYMSAFKCVTCHVQCYCFNKNTKSSRSWCIYHISDSLLLDHIFINNATLLAILPLELSWCHAVTLRQTSARLVMMVRKRIAWKTLKLAGLKPVKPKG